MFLRLPRTQAAYDANRAQYTDFTHTKDYREDEEKIIREYTHWYIIPNLFPYDNVAEVHDMLVPKRVFGTLSEANNSERREYETICAQLETEGYYDSLIANFSKHRSVCKHLHLHLIVWKQK